MLTQKAKMIMTTARQISVRKWRKRRTPRLEGVRPIYVSISNEDIADGETVVSTIAALNVRREATGEETASYEILQLDPGSPEVAEEGGNPTEIATRQLRSRHILGVDRTDPITVNHYYVMSAATVKLCKNVRGNCGSLSLKSFLVAFVYEPIFSLSYSCIPVKVFKP